jgi:hypothetical protein
MSQGLTVTAVAGDLTNVHFTPLDKVGIRQYATSHQVRLTVDSELTKDAILTITLENDSESFFAIGDTKC